MTTCLSARAAPFAGVRIHARPRRRQNRVAAESSGGKGDKRSEGPRADKPDSAQKGPYKVEQLKAYDERDGKLYAARKREQDDQDRGSIADLVPGGNVADRPDPAGGQAVLDRQQQQRSLKINTDLALYRARSQRIRAGRVNNAPEARKSIRAAEDSLLEVLRRDPTDERAYVSLSNVYIRQRRHDEARRLLEEGCALAQGKNAWIWTAMGNLEVKDGNDSKARQYFQAALTAREHHDAAYHSWARLERRTGNLKKSRDLLLRGLRTCPEPSPYLYEAMASLAASLDLVDEARYWFREGTNSAMGANSNALWTGWANLEWKVEGDIDMARYCFSMLQKVHKRSRYGYLGQAMMEKSLGNLERAVELIEEGLRYNVTDAALFQAHGVAVAELGKVNWARHSFRLGLEQDPAYLHIWHAWAVMEGRLGRHDVARQLFQKAVETCPRNRNLVFLWQAWGYMEGRLGNLVQARSLFQAGIQLDATNAACWRAWIHMEEDNDLLESATALRNMQMQAFESETVPNLFSTMPEEGGSDVINTVVRWMRELQRPGASQRAARSFDFQWLDRLASSSGSPRERATDGTDAAEPQSSAPSVDAVEVLRSANVAQGTQPPGMEDVSPGLSRVLLAAQNAVDQPDGQAQGGREKNRRRAWGANGSSEDANSSGATNGLTGPVDLTQAESPGPRLGAGRRRRRQVPKAPPPPSGSEDELSDQGDSEQA